MSFFKKALLATTIASTIGAVSVQAADVSDAVTSHSIQGLAAGVAPETSSVRVIVREVLEAGDVITLEFGDGITAISSVDDTGIVTSPGAGVVSLVYGTGVTNFALEFDAAASDLSKGVVVVKVATGNPIPLDGSFEIYVAADLYDIQEIDEATVTYSAVSGLTGDAKDVTGDNVGNIVTLADQYAVEVTGFNGVIDRNNQNVFIRSGDAIDAANDDATTDDAMLVKVTDNTSLLSAITVATDPATTTIEATLTGSFKNYGVSADLISDGTAFITNAAGSAVLAGATADVDATGASIDVSVPLAAFTTGFENFYVVLSAPTPADKFIPVTTFEIDADVDYDTLTDFPVLSDVYAGEWMLDAAIINIPYFPVGFEGTQSSIHLANENSTAVNVMVEAFAEYDTAGEESVVYDQVEFGDIEANSVTKISQTKIMELFDITDSAKLSVTFNVDAVSGTVKAYAFTQNANGRSEISDK